MADQLQSEGCCGRSGHTVASQHRAEGSQVLHGARLRGRSLLVAVLMLSVLLAQLTAKLVPGTDFLLNIDGVSIAVGHEHICVIEQRPSQDSSSGGSGGAGDFSIGGRAQCWGYETKGRTNAPKEVDFIQLVAGAAFSCGITMDQTVLCWGAISGQIDGLYTQITAPSNRGYACGVLLGGKLKCWGNSRDLHQIPHDPALNFVQISCSTFHCCALDYEGHPHCFGIQGLDFDPPLVTLAAVSQLEGTENPVEDVYEEDFDDIQLDLPARTFDDVAAEESLESLSKIQLRQISVGERFSCGITLLGSHLRCWGDTRKDHSSLERGLGQLPIYSPGPFRQVSVGPQGVCAIAGELEHLEEQRIRRESGFPELGEGDPVPHTDITAVTGISKRVQNQQRQQHKQHINLPVDSLACWGSAKDLVRPEPEDSWDQIYVGSSTICGVTMESELRCWGANVPHHLRDHHKSFVVA